MTSTGVWDIIHGMQRAKAMLAWNWRVPRDQDGEAILVQGMQRAKAIFHGFDECQGSDYKERLDPMRSSKKGRK